MAFYVYMLLCADNSIYTGHTDDLEARLFAHHYCGYTAKRLPVKLIFTDTFATRDEAFAAERQIKGWSRAKKLALAEWDWELVQRLSLRQTPQPEEFRGRSAHGFENLTMSGRAALTRSGPRNSPTAKALPGKPCPRS